MCNDGCRDFRTGETIELQSFFNDNIDIHHIFPKKWCEQQDIDKDIYNCIVNKTALSSRTNRILGGNAPSEYLRIVDQSPQGKLSFIDEHSTSDKPNMDEILKSHCISADALRTDDFDQFFKTRKEALLNAIKKAGVRVSSEDDSPTDTEN